MTPPPLSPALALAPAPGALRGPTGTGWAVAAAILFWPLGIPALVGAQRASLALGAGDAASAEHHARTARRYGIAAVVVTCVLSAVLSVALIVGVVVALADAGWVGDSVLGGGARG